ncbi:E3 ubiquitin-protein ligase UPL7 isoform X1 [Ricinus communis]|uniref:E3 ubiquitin-protein ligase UPL7 isoform X1 n=2 Tax=Ricinus communis TaxID=3988 RepID=UPI00201AF26C|nr:E3 ubiquitin-protein ligase UPL7 isoform X1 [Ricinus communis]XP_015580523.2 E3 ubiquitin-protein ligase UPL7 isoform X1 [Ricinus communis]XP_025014799.2 E3 ubiquitin-protein ligase UPL7 isoform X1 [Ricinus communis]
MDEPRRHQVSLRGASAREISRDALLEKVYHERELRSYARRATASAIFIQRVWRRYIVTKKVAFQLQEEWESMLNHHDGSITASWISNSLLRPFLFFVACSSTRHQKICTRDIYCMQTCFKILLESINCTDSRKNFCSLSVGSLEERRMWTFQSKKLICLCSFILSECDKSHAVGHDIVVLTSVAMHFLVVLTDLNGWKGTTNSNLEDTNVAVNHLIRFMGSCKSGLYISIRTFINKLDIHVSSQTKNMVQTDDKFLITATAVTLALRPFHASSLKVTGSDLLDMDSAVVQYFLFILTIPRLIQRLPAVLLSALKHKSILSPCLQTLLILRDNILTEMMQMDHPKMQRSSKVIPSVGWALANIIGLAAGSENDFMDPGRLNQSLEYAFYVRVVTILAESLLSWLHGSRWTEKDNQCPEVNADSSAEPGGHVLDENETACALKMNFVDLLRPASQQWHLKKLLAITKTDAYNQTDETSTAQNSKYLRKLELLDIAHFYSYMLRMYSILNSSLGPLPILNMLSFTPGYLATLWEALEKLLFPQKGHITADDGFAASKISGNKKDGDSEKKQRHLNKDGGNKWANVLHKITGKSQAGVDFTGSVDGEPSEQVEEDLQDVWDVELLRSGPQKISKDILCLLHLFCATYSHLLLVLDDIEFYEKQVPFTSEQQRRIASVLNTFVYNGLAHSADQQCRSLMESAIRCLHMMYERDCRRQFCPPALWLSPARKSRPPIAVAARTHESVLSNLKPDDALTVPSIGSVITTIPHVYPFEERVQMFREFVNMDKVSRKMAGEVTGPGSRAVEIVVRRGHIVEDGFRQLNTLGSRLKSSIHVSFVSECGVPEAGLDYGGLSKEFLTDISKASFSPEYGLFSQTSTSERLLIPNPSAKYLENGIQMIEFLGRVVGKALYEGILLDYSFSHVFVQKLLGRYSFVDELSTLDPELYRNLMYVKHYDGDLKDLFLDFTITEESFGKRHVIELKPGGKNVSVTNENKMQYIHAMADYKLNRQILAFSNAFYRGLTDIISPSWLKLFNASEFNQLLSGGDFDIDVDDLRDNTRYTGGYSEGSRTIKLFWEVIKGFEPNEWCMLLKFVTSCSRAPLLGFKHLQPSFTIHKVACDASLWATIGGQDVERLPSASTCYNTLKLPTYKRATTLRAKLLYAISSNTGFELS